MRWRSATLLLLTAASAQSQGPPQEFSADIVRRDASGAPIGATAKLHAARHKTRIDGLDASGGFFVTDNQAGSAFFVRPAQHIYMDAGQSTPLTQIFIPVEPRDPCRQWQTAARIAGAAGAEGWRCVFIGPGRFDNRETLKYRVLSPGSAGGQRWIESGLGFPVKARTEDGATIALENIRIGSQPESLFSVPSDYRKLDPQALIERIKHSDVWVGP
ncbi:MAG TPA: hypothetical protein VHW95_11250 [Steroidobacteraceae bacterium]|jgi:hypothetical protein|nr:hypothetical protein [Steroidobacteraceae bacterium]